MNTWRSRHALHSNVRRSTSRASIGSISLIEVSPPHAGHSPRAPMFGFLLLIGAVAVNAKQILGEAPLLLIVETGIELLGRVGELLPVVGALDLSIGVLAHLLDDVDGAVPLCAFLPQGDLAIGPLLAHV